MAVRKFQIVLLSLVTWAGGANGDSLLCNRTQTRCMTETRQLTIGDRIGVFNRDGEVVAIGQVQAMRGDRRSVKINRRFGRIHKGYDVALLQGRPGTERFTERYTVYRSPAQMSVGGAAGLGRLGIGKGAPSVELTGFAQWRMWRGVQVVARASYLSAQADVSHISPVHGGFENVPMEFGGYGLLGGLGYVAGEKKLLSLRGEVAAGTLYVDGMVNGDPALMDDPAYDTKVTNGFNLYGRGEVAALLNLASWRLKVGLSESMAAEALGTTLGAGLVVDLD